MLEFDIQAKYIGQLSLMQSVMIGLPDEKSIGAFVCRGLLDIPGVAKVELKNAGVWVESEKYCRYRINKNEELYLSLELSNEAEFLPYEQYISNFSMMLKIIFEERKHRKEIEFHKSELEDRVEERTCQLKSEVEERLLIEESLRKSELLFRLSFDDAVMGGYMLDRDGRFIKCNATFCQLVGYSESELLGMDLFQITDPEDIALSKHEIGELIAGNKISSRFCKQYICRNGQTMSAKVSATTVHNSLGDTEFIISYISDISEEKRLQSRLVSNEQKYRSIFEGLTTGMVLLDIAYNSDGSPSDYIVMEANRAFCKIVEIQQAEITGKNIYEAFPSLTKKYQDWLSSADVTGRLEISDEYNEKLQKYIDLWVFFPEPGMCAVMLSDVTEREKTREILLRNEQMLKEQNEEYEALNEELNERNIQLFASKEKAEESDRLKSAFLANMSHEIRTPMNGIIGFSDLISSSELTQQKRQYYSDIVKNSCMQLLSIVNDIIDISKIETGQIRLSENKVNINDLILFLYSFYKPVSQKNNISLFQSKNLNDREATIFTDELKLKQIMNNFLSNATKFTHQGHIRFGYQQSNEHIEFYVEDTGIGIAEEDCIHIFDRFAQARQADANQYGGTGLGLAIAKAYIEKLGGSVHLKSEINCGSRFSFIIPYRPVYTDCETDDRIPYSNKPLHTVLVVEDEEVNYLYLEEVLKRIGLGIIHAKNGAEAIDIITSDEKIDLILLDIKLPDINGFDLLPQILAARPGIPVIAQTAYAMSGDREKALNKGCCDYIAKPIIRLSLIETLNKYLDTEND